MHRLIHVPELPKMQQFPAHPGTQAEHSRRLVETRSWPSVPHNHPTRRRHRRGIC